MDIDTALHSRTASTIAPPSPLSPAVASTATASLPSPSSKASQRNSRLFNKNHNNKEQHPLAASGHSRRRQRPSQEEADAEVHMNENQELGEEEEEQEEEEEDELNQEREWSSTMASEQTIQVIEPFNLLPLLPPDLASTSVSSPLSTPKPAKLKSRPTSTSSSRTQPMQRPSAEPTTSSSSSTTKTVLKPAASLPLPKNREDEFWSVVAGLDKLVAEAKFAQIILVAEIQDLMSTIEDHCSCLGMNAANISSLLALPDLAPKTISTRQKLQQTVDDLAITMTCRQPLLDRWTTRVETIASHICESPEPYFEISNTMAPLSKARLLYLERIYQVLEKEWMSRMQDFDRIVGALRVRWDQCGFLPVDDYDFALEKLFILAVASGDAEEASLVLKIELPLCLSKECLSALCEKLEALDQDYAKRRMRVRTMEQALRVFYRDLEIPPEQRILFEPLATVQYSAKLGRALKALQSQLNERRETVLADSMEALVNVWDMCLVTTKERDMFNAQLHQEDLGYTQKRDLIRAELNNCTLRFSRCGPIFKLMMSRRSLIEKMIAFEKSASSPARLFQSSFQLNEEEKFRRKAFPTLLKYEDGLFEAVAKYEHEHKEPFIYDGVDYLTILRAEIEDRHVNETVFAKFTAIAAPTRSQTAQIMKQPSSAPNLRATATMHSKTMPPPSTSPSSPSPAISTTLATVRTPSTATTTTAPKSRLNESPPRSPSSSQRPKPPSSVSSVYSYSSTSSSSTSSLVFPAHLSGASDSGIHLPRKAGGLRSALRSGTTAPVQNGGGFQHSSPPSSTSSTSSQPPAILGPSRLMFGGNNPNSVSHHSGVISKATSLKYDSSLNPLTLANLGRQLKSKGTGTNSMNNNNNKTPRHGSQHRRETSTTSTSSVTSNTSSSATLSSSVK